MAESTSLAPATGRYDCIVIGSGPAGERGAAQAAALGKRVALVERSPRLGGAAANTGTLPSKTLRETALYLTGYKQRDLSGLAMNLRKKITMQDLMVRERFVAETERQRIAGNLGRYGVDVLHGAASFVDPHRIRIDGSEVTEIEGDVILIATGSRPWHPPVFPMDAPGILDSDTILQLENLPRSLVVAGGGVIGCEYACVFATLGVDVTIVEARDTLLGFLDAELSRRLKERMVALGVRFEMPDTVMHVARDDEGEQTGWSVALNYGGAIVVDAVLIAAGRMGNTDSLNLDAAGVPMGPRGLLSVDSWFRTAVPHIFASGDVIGFPALASASMEQARLAMRHAFDENCHDAFAPILPSGVYTIPEVSSAGETEASAKEKGMDIVVGRANFAANARGQIIGDHHGFLKLLFVRDDMRLVGAHVLGECASELIHIGLTAMLAGAGADLFLRSCYNYPTLSETYKAATDDALARRASGH